MGKYLVKVNKDTTTTCIRVVEETFLETLVGRYMLFTRMYPVLFQTFKNVWPLGIRE